MRRQDDGRERTDDARDPSAPPRDSDAAQLTLAARLREREKELALIHDVAMRLQDDAASIADHLAWLCARLPAAWFSPELAHATVRVQHPDLGELTAGAEHGSERSVEAALAASRQFDHDGSLTLSVGYVADADGVTPTFLSEEARLLESLADVLAGWLARRTTALRSLALQRDLARLAHVRQHLGDTYASVLEGTLDDVPERVLRAALQTIPNASLGSVLVRSDDGRYRFAAVEGYDAALLQLRLPATGILFGHDLSRTEPFFVTDLPGADATLSDSAARRELARISAAAKPVESLVAPIVVDGVLLAAISLERRAADAPFPDDAATTLHAYAQGVAVVFQRHERDTHTATMVHAVTATSDAIAVVDVPRQAGVGGAGAGPRFRLANPALAHLLGVELDALERWDPLAALGMATLTRGFRALRRAIRTREPAQFDVELRGADGQLRWLDVAVTLLERDAERARVLLVLRDVTAARAQLQELERVNAELAESLSEARTLEAIDAAITSGAEQGATLARVAAEVGRRPGITHVRISVGAGDDASDAQRRMVPVAVWHAPDGDGAATTFERSLPLISREALVGRLELALTRDFTPSPRWEAFLAVVAAQVAIAIENTTMITRLQEASTAYADLAAFSGRMEELDDAEALVEEGVRTLLATFGMHGAILFERVGDTLTPLQTWGVFDDPERPALQPFAIGEGAVGQAAISGAPVYVANYRDWRHAAQQPALHDVSAVLGLPIRSDGSVERALALVSVAEAVQLRSDQVEIARAFVLRLERALERAAVQKNIEATREAAFRTLGVALEQRDFETRGHTDRVVTLAQRLGERVGLDRGALEALTWGAYLHDVGKIGIPDQVLLKPGRLSAAEMASVQRHSVLGADMIADLRFIPTETREVVRSHHERWDGQGYPDGLAGASIPYLARLFSLVDVYDALRSTRPYKPAWSRAEALSELAAQAGRQFDPALCRTFLSLLAEDHDDGLYTAAP